MKNKKKWILLGIVIFLLILFGLYRYYIYIIQDQHSQETTAITAAKKNTELVKVTDTQKSVWDTISWVIEGKDKDQRDLMVWVQFTEDNKLASGLNAIHSELVENGLSEEQIRSKIINEIPGIEEIRIQPGMYYGEYVWQVYYLEKDHYYYRFYKFKDGSPVGDRYTLPNR
ncbi:cell wall elongation regulator TseB-like domain-containing protein [Paenibacillus sp. IHBB 10380]|uniref:cell wall elongation regulator TseB-like domain-containing protein n=1 Tax=Paenibacillus sp. IHBB 10380 TaxID=1566358 RepID=UPI0005CF9B11|nr:DUF5590 domain-containing protein [Paenibacillus sp. IHBB 10380]AJS58078.1 hypothetical protein UB51_05700 [Paenibacillus sp. IHBB 10380]